MRLDIVIPTLNESNNLKELLPYLRSNSPLNNTNIVVVDSVLSNDNSKSICLQHDTQYLKSSETQRSIQMNKASLESTADALLFVHADVRPPIDFYTQINQSLNLGYKAGFFSYHFNSDNWLLKINAKTTKTDGWFAGGGDQCHFFDRSTFQKLGGYCSQHLIMEDFEMIDRLRMSNIKFNIIDSPAIVSSRKYNNNSYLKVNLINLITFIKYKRKTNSSEILKFYKKWLD